MTHRAIKRFYLEGQINDDSSLWRSKETLTNTLVRQMRDAGYVRTLDVDPAWSTQYKEGHYTFLLTIHGVYVGKKRAQEVYGIMGQREVMME
jgi:hypothetical protein